MISKIGKNKSYCYCINYSKKKCTSNSGEKTKPEKMILEELKIDKITRNNLYKKVNVIYIIDNKTIIIDYKKE